MTAALIAKLESASEGSRELDAAITAWMNDAVVVPYPPATDFGPSAKWQFWTPDGSHFLGNESKFAVHPVTTSIDAALALAERVWAEAMPTIDQRTSDCWLCLMGEAPNVIDAWARTAPLAICAALLRASAAEGAGE